MGYDSTLLCSEEAQESAELGSNDGTSLNGKKAQPSYHPWVV